MLQLRSGYQTESWKYLKEKFWTSTANRNPSQLCHRPTTLTRREPYLQMLNAWTAQLCHAHALEAPNSISFPTPHSSSITNMVLVHWPGINKFQMALGIEQLATMHYSTLRPLSSVGNNMWQSHKHYNQFSFLTHERAFVQKKNQEFTIQDPYYSNRLKLVSRGLSLTL